MTTEQAGLSRPVYACLGTGLSAASASRLASEKSDFLFLFLQMVGRRRRHSPRHLQILSTHLFVISFSLLFLSFLCLLKWWNDVALPDPPSFVLHTQSAEEASASNNYAVVDIDRYFENLENLLLLDEVGNITAFCTSWDVNVDHWWTHHVTWVVATQNRTHQCFRKLLERTKKAVLFDKLYRIQWVNASCYDDTTMITKILSNSGWGADLSHVVDGLLYAVTNDVPVQLVFPVPWQYTVGRLQQNNNRPVCPTADLSCYFLPLSNCETTTRRSQHWRIGPLSSESKAHYLYPWHGFYSKSDDRIQSLLQYATRPQTWLRRKAVALAATLDDLPTDCSVMHVRRSDVVLHGVFSRAYHKISEYVRAASPLLGPNVLLLTDDANAIAEALAYNSRRRNNDKHTIHWFYLDRPRHKGPEGGWENQIPSQNPEWEVVVLHATFLLIQRCNLLVHSKSNLADYYFATMKLRQQQEVTTTPRVTRIDLDEFRNHNEVHNANNVETTRISTRYNAISW
jgi:hypothetical protein